MLYHYYSRFYGELYEYTINTKFFFKFGYLGVELFFIISGFVIFLTLRKTKSLKDFIKKRYIRLAPGMLASSILTFFFFYLLNPPFRSEAGELKNLLFSNTFLSPSFSALVLKDFNFNYTDGAYWSIWVEICFYIFVSVLYYLNRTHIIRNFSLFNILGTLLYFLNLNLPSLGLQRIALLSVFFDVFNFFRYALWFLIGIYLLRLYESRERKFLVGITAILLILCLISNSVTVTLFNILVWFIIYSFVYRPHFIEFLGNSFFSRLGVATYSVYLIHQNLGVLFISKLSPYFGPYNFVLGIFAIIFSFGIGVLLYEVFEKKAAKKLYNLLLSSKN